MSTSVPRPVRGSFAHSATGQRPDLFVYIPLASAQPSWCELPDWRAVVGSTWSCWGTKPNFCCWLRGAVGGERVTGTAALAFACSLGFCRIAGFRPRLVFYSDMCPFFFIKPRLTTRGHSHPDLTRFPGSGTCRTVLAKPGHLATM